jgi:hypothetical protein
MFSSNIRILYTTSGIRILIISGEVYPGRAAGAPD